MRKSDSTVWPLAAAMVMVASTGLAAEAQQAPSLAVTLDAAGVAHVGPFGAAPSSLVPEPVRTAAAEAEPAALGSGRESITAGATDAEGSHPICRRGEVLAPAEAEALVRRVAQAEDFYPDFVLSVARIESHFRADQVSPKGAIGLMQLMPAMAARFAVDICDPADNVRGGVRYLRTLHERYHNPFYMLAAYNAGEDAVAQYRGVPPFPETVRYVADVINDFYTLPPVGTARRAGVHVAAGKRTPEHRPTPAEQAEPGWSQGFVMHVEN